MARLNMHFARELIIAIFLSFLVGCKCDRVFFNSCGQGGFHCVNAENSKINITFNCNAQTKQDIIIYVWSFRSPTTVGNLKIQNCENVTLYTTCTTEQKIIKTIWLLNITNLFIMPSPINLNPQNFIFENINNINIVPKETFSHAFKRTYRPGCTPVGIEMQQLIFRNVHMTVVETHAFYNVSNVELFAWENVSVDVMQTSALKLEMKKSGEMWIKKSKLDTLEHLAFQITGENVSFLGNNFGDIQGSGINGTIQNFQFYNNTIETFQANGFSLLSQNVYMFDNRFEYLHSGAFQKVSPGLLSDSNTNFGKLQFVYEFIGNVIFYVDVGGLNPDTVAYSNVAAKVSFARNALFCSCEKLGWISLEFGLGHNQAGMVEFYKDALDEKNKNICTFTSCTLPLKTIITLYDKCLDGVVFKDYCADKKKPKVIKIEYNEKNGTSEEFLDLSFGTCALVSHVTLILSILFLVVF